MRGPVLLRRLADQVGLTRGLAGVLPSSTAGGWRDRAAALDHLAAAIVLGARSLLGDVYKLTSVRGPSSIIVMLAQELKTN